MDKPGLKSMSTHRLNPGKVNIPRDSDGAYRVAGRKDGLKPSECFKAPEVEV